MALFRDLTKKFDDLRSVLWELERIYAFPIACKKRSSIEIGYLHSSHRSFDINKYIINIELHRTVWKDLELIKFSNKNEKKNQTADPCEN